MCTREEYADLVRAALETKRSAPLSSAAMEALTIIAYNQPVSKGFVENVRGIDSSSVINNLCEKPIIYRTTALFLRSFGLSSIADLPPLPGQEQLSFDSIDTDCEEL